MTANVLSRSARTERTQVPPMDLVFLSRVQFGLTIAFHYIFPPLSIGLGLFLVLMEGAYLRSRDPVYERMTRFWVRIFGLIFALGVATGIVMEFQFGTNWATYSRYVGDVFGSALAAEGVFAFFLESGFLAILLFGWERVKPRIHFLATILVAAGAHFSAIWIVAANSWQQTPAGHRIVEAAGGTRAETIDFWAVIFNPSFVDRILHVCLGAWLAAAFFVMSVSAFYLLRDRHVALAKASMRFGIVIAAAASILQLVTGHESARTVAAMQPAKLAAMEAHFAEHAPASLYLVGWVDENAEKVTGVEIPGLTSFLTHGDSSVPLAGLRAFRPEDRPPVNAVFQGYHLMVTFGMLLILLSMVAAARLLRGTLFTGRRFLRVLVAAVLLPQLANQAGWFTAEVGRQPWIVYGLLRTEDAVSRNVKEGSVVASLVLFSLIYLVLFALFVFLLDGKIRHGPDEAAVEGHRA